LEVVLLLGDREDCGEVGMAAGGGDEVSGGGVTGRGIDGIKVVEGGVEDLLDHLEQSSTELYGISGFGHTGILSEQGFHTFINGLQGTFKLDRVVVDEAHWVSDSRPKVRSKMRELGRVLARSCNAVGVFDCHCRSGTQPGFSS
jgi:hypothetical protein